MDALNTVPERDYSGLPHAVQLTDQGWSGLAPWTPRQAVDHYWYRHHGRAWVVAMGLADRSSWHWNPLIIRSPEHRKPPLPFNSLHSPGRCCFCGQPIHALGWHCEIEGRKARADASWHAACGVAYRFMLNPGAYLDVPEGHEADHFIPLYKVARDCDWTWPRVLEFWGPGNIQILSREDHAQKSAAEARERAEYRRAA